MNFVTIDVETANPDRASICQIGVAVYTNGELTDEWGVLVNPEDYFDARNIAIHGIDAGMVQFEPRMPEVAEKLRSMLEGRITTCYTHFDRTAVEKSFDKYGLWPIETQWLDLTRVVRHTWPEFAWKGYKLPNVCQNIGYKFVHHDALEDAKAAGAVLLAAMKESQRGLDYWLNRATKEIDTPRPPSRKLRDAERMANPDGRYFGDVLVFTGELGISRDDAADLAAGAGYTVGQGVTNKTTVLVVGRQDFRTKLAGYEKSSKHRKAEELISTGSKIRIIYESDFMAIVKAEK